MSSDTSDWTLLSADDLLIYDALNSDLPDNNSRFNFSSSDPPEAEDSQDKEEEDKDESLRPTEMGTTPLEHAKDAGPTDDELWAILFPEDESF